MALTWSREKCPAEELPRGRHVSPDEHVHHCGCGRYAICTAPPDRCDESDDCPDCIEEQIEREQRCPRCGSTNAQYRGDRYGCGDCGLGLTP